MRKGTPLHYASYNGHPKAVNFLLKREADHDELQLKRNTQKRTAFIIAKSDAVKKAFNRKLYFFFMIIYLIFYSDIWKAAKDGDLDMVRIQLRQHPDELIGRTKYRGNTPMHMAAQNGHYLIVKFLLERGADSTITNLDEQTPKDLLMKSLTSQELKIKKIKKKQKIDQKELQNAYDSLKGMKDTYELLTYSEQSMGGP